MVVIPFVVMTQIIRCPLPIRLGIFAPTIQTILIAFFYFLPRITVIPVVIPIIPTIITIVIIIVSALVTAVVADHPDPDHDVAVPIDHYGVAAPDQHSAEMSMERRVKQAE